MNELVKEIKRLKKEKNAVILAHYYVPDEVQEIADYIGDSFYLSKVVMDVDADVLVFAGVSFMGESAKILNPGKTVLMPDMEADCPMAHMVDLEKLEEIRSSHDDIAVVCYINSTAELKTHADVCVTSANAVKIVKALPNQTIFFVPDQHLGEYVSKFVPEKEFIFNDGYCPIHHVIQKEEVLKTRAMHPEAEFLAHPECPREILEIADYVGSTTGIIEYATKSEKQEFVIGTEDGVLYELRSRNPKKKFYPATAGQCCPGMKLVTLEKIRKCLETGEGAVEISSDLREKAKRSLDRMLELAK